MAARIVVLLVLVASFLAASPDTAATQAASGWEATAVDQVVRRVALSGDVVYALVPAEDERPSALWRGDGAGTSWQTLTLPAERIVDLAVDPTDPSVLYVAGSGGV